VHRIAAGRRVLSSSSSSPSSPPKSLPALWTRPAGEGGLLLRFGNQIDLATNARVVRHLQRLDATVPPKGVLEVLPAYASLLVHFDPLEVSAQEVEAWCLSVAADSGSGSGSGGGGGGGGGDGDASSRRTVAIPVRYGGKHGPDMEAAAALAGLTQEEVTALHASGDYRVYFLGFTGGFPYMGGLPEELAGVPRLTTPRQKVSE
jgi:inhibitor of KinA